MNKNISFNDIPVGPYSIDRINADWNNPKRIMGAISGRTNIVPDPLGVLQNVL